MLVTALIFSMERNEFCLKTRCRFVGVWFPAFSVLVKDKMISEEEKKKWEINRKRE